MTQLTDREILVIDDSPAIGIFFRDFLKKLGFEKIHCCENGKFGVDEFEKLVKGGETPIVFLDYNLPDMNAYSVMTQMLSIQPNVKVIIATAREKHDDAIKEVIAQGAYQYLPKPLRLENIKEIMDTLQREEEYGDSMQTDDTQKSLEFFIRSSSQTSLTRISQHLGKTKEETLPLLQKLKSENKIIQLDDIKEIACPDCGLVRVSQIYRCPSCKGTNFKQEKLIEHYECGNVSPEKTYEEDYCPKCRKEIKVMGVDYKIMDNFYICNSCNEKFPEISSEFLCLKCNNEFPLEKGKWDTSAGFRGI